MNSLVIKAHHLEELKASLTSFFDADVVRYDPFHPILIEFCETLSQRLFRHEDGKNYPDFIALAFWLRKTHLNELEQTFIQTIAPEVLLMPRGIVFHFPPANIDVMLVYSWICSLLMGNRNVIRIPSAHPPRAQSLLQIICETLSMEKFADIGKMTRFIQYGHEESMTTWISSRVDLRIIWGGDESIALIRKIPLQAHAKEVVFPDRFSFAAIDAEAYVQLSSERQKQLVTNFFNDTYWFDQSACSSPKMLFWIGKTQLVDEVSQSFYHMLQEIIQQRRFEISLGGVLLKNTLMYDQALTISVQKAYQLSNELSVLVLNQAEDRCRIHCGQGLFYHVAVNTLEEMIPFVTHRDQTLLYFGFSKNSLRKLVLKLCGKGITRLVPFGQALNFDPFWDGQNLFYELTQHVVLRV